MLPALLKRLLIPTEQAELTPLGVGETPAKAAYFQYIFFGEDSQTKGEAVLAHQTNTHSNFYLTTFGSVPATSPDGVFWQEPSGEILIDFQVNFVEGEEVDSLKGKLTLLDWLSKENQGRWIASVRSSGREVAMAQGTWSRCKIFDS